jgi:carbon storage regulator
MLVLTRKLMERLFIGDDICVTVVRLEGGQVRLGIDAPREISVVRAELVPERLSEYSRREPPPHSARPAPTSLTRRPFAAHETGTRPRGRSR